MLSADMATLYLHRVILVVDYLGWVDLYLESVTMAGGPLL